MLNWTLPIATWFSRNFHCGHRFWIIISYFWRSQRLLQQERCSQWRWCWRELMRSAVMNFWKKRKKIVLKNQCTKSHLCDIKLACFDILWYLPKVLYFCVPNNHAHISPSPLPNNVHHIIPFLSSTMMRDLCAPSQNFFCDPLYYYTHVFLRWCFLY